MKDEMTNPTSVLPHLFLSCLKCNETSVNQFHASQTGSTSIILRNCAVLFQALEFSFLTDPHMSAISCIKLSLEPMIVISLGEENAEILCFSNITISHL